MGQAEPQLRLRHFLGDEFIMAIHIRCTLHVVFRFIRLLQDANVKTLLGYFDSLMGIKASLMPNHMFTAHQMYVKRQNLLTRAKIDL